MLILQQNQQLWKLFHSWWKIHHVLNLSLVLFPLFIFIFIFSFTKIHTANTCKVIEVIFKNSSRRRSIFSVVLKKSRRSVEFWKLPFSFCEWKNQTFKKRKSEIKSNLRSEHHPSNHLPPPSISRTKENFRIGWRGWRKFPNQLSSQGKTQKKLQLENAFQLNSTENLWIISANKRLKVKQSENTFFLKINSDKINN